MYLDILTRIVGAFMPFWCYFFQRKECGYVYIYVFWCLVQAHWLESFHSDFVSHIDTSFPSFDISTENADFRLITWWIGFEEQVLYISVLRKPHSMLSLSPLLCSNEQQTLSRYQMWKDCPIFLDVIFCRPAALDDNRLPPKLSNHYYWNISDLRKFFDQTYKKRSH